MTIKAMKKPAVSCRFATRAVIVRVIVRSSRYGKTASLAISDTAYLANLCHNCGACYPRANMPRRMNLPLMCLKHWPSAGSTVTPIMLGHLPWAVFLKKRSSGLTCDGYQSFFGSGFNAGDDQPNAVLGVHIGEGAFYQIMPHTVMAGIPLAITAFVIVSFILSWRQYWRAAGIKFGGFSALLMRSPPAQVCVILAVIMRVAPRGVHPAMTVPAMPENITIT